MNIITAKFNKDRGIMDTTGKINGIIKNQSFKDSLVYLFILHTTCALMMADLEEGFKEDYFSAFKNMLTKIRFIHPHNPKHFLQHFLSSLVENFLLLLFENKKLTLGTCQRLVLIEFNGQRERNIYYKIFKTNEK